MRRRWLATLLAVLTFAAAFPLMGLIGKEFVPAADNNEIFVRFYTPVGSSLELTQDKVNQAQAALREFDGVLFTYATVNTGAVQGRNYATLFGKLTERSKRPLSVQQLRQPVRERLSRIPGITLTDVGTMSSVGSGKPVQVSVQGPDMRQLERLAEQAQSAMLKIPGVVDLDSSSKPSKPTVSVEVNRALASDLGVGVAQRGAATTAGRRIRHDLACARRRELRRQGAPAAHRSQFTGRSRAPHADVVAARSGWLAAHGRDAPDRRLRPGPGRPRSTART